nr:PREDICTED: afadin- and alpha-actinin-binding protein-like [Paralichthys olivaceus]
MPESSSVKDIRCSSAECRTSPLRQFSQSSLPLHRNYVLSTFCTEHNVQACLSHINQEMSSLGLPPLWMASAGSSEINVVAVLNCMYDLIQLHRRGVRTLENLEVEHLKSSSNVDFLRLTSTQLKTDSEDEEEVFDSSKESVELYCAHAREKLTNSIRLQWRKLKSHMERLDSQASLAQMSESKNTDAVAQETQEEEMDRLKLEIHQCKDFIQTQQQLLQQQISSPCDEETGSLLSDCYVSQGKERLREEWKTLEEQRKIFERERRNFTEAAIRLSLERKTFEEDRATWLKHQFLNLSPFAETKKPPMSKSKSAFLISESEGSAALSPEKLVKCQSDTTSPTHRCFSFTSPSTDDLCRTLRLIPEISSTRPKTERVEESNIFCNGTDPVQHKWWNNSKDPHTGNEQLCDTPKSLII